VLLANYRSNPKGERAADSLYYLGQALMKLGQPGQACKAYAELEAVYGAGIRVDLKKQVADAKAQGSAAKTPGRARPILAMSCSGQRVSMLTVALARCRGGDGR